jgi:hypothetical protein
MTRATRFWAAAGKMAIVSESKADKKRVLRIRHIVASYAAPMQSTPFSGQRL